MATATAKAIFVMILSARSFARLGGKNSGQSTANG